MVLGHGTLMHYIEHCHRLGYQTEHYHFLLPGRPILKALKTHLNYIDDTVKAREGCEDEWKPIAMGPRKEHLLRLDDDLTSQKLTGPYAFDYVLEETYNPWTQRPPDTQQSPEHYTLWHYLELTGQRMPDLQLEEALRGDDPTEQQETSSDSDSNETSDPSDDDTTHWRALTDKPVRTLRLHQQQQALHRKATTDEVLAAHETRTMQFWKSTLATPIGQPPWPRKDTKSRPSTS